MPPMNQNTGAPKMPAQTDFFEISELTSENISKKNVSELREIIANGTDAEKKLAQERFDEIARKQREEDAEERLDPLYNRGK